MSQEQIVLRIYMQIVIFLGVSSVDHSNYKTLFGILDNCFLVAYAIGMFFRYAFHIFTRMFACFWVTQK